MLSDDFATYLTPRVLVSRGLQLLQAQEWLQHFN